MERLTAQQIRSVVREKIPAGLVVAEHTDEGHFYRHTPTDRLLASVTTKTGILDEEHLKAWAASEAIELLRRKWHLITPDNRESIFDEAILAHKDIFEDAGDIGTRGHTVIERYLNTWIDSGEKPARITAFIGENDPRLFAISRSAEAFCNGFSVEPISSELKVCSLKYNYAGTLDFLAMVKLPGTYRKRFALVDWKTSNTIRKPTYAMQTAAYWWALKEMTGLVPEVIIIVRLDKGEAKYEVMRVNNPKDALKAFNNLSPVQAWLTSGAEKLTPLFKKKKRSII